MLHSKLDPISIFVFVSDELVTVSDNHLGSSAVGLSVIIESTCNGVRFSSAVGLFSGRLTCSNNDPNWNSMAGEGEEEDSSRKP